MSLDKVVSEFKKTAANKSLENSIRPLKKEVAYYAGSYCKIINSFHPSSHASWDTLKYSGKRSELRGYEQTNIEIESSDGDAWDNPVSSIIFGVSVSLINKTARISMDVEQQGLVKLSTSLEEKKNKKNQRDLKNFVKKEWAKMQSSIKRDLEKVAKDNGVKLKIIPYMEESKTKLEIQCGFEINEVSQVNSAKRVVARLEVASEMQIIKDCAKAIRQNSTLTPIEKKSEVGGGECFIEIDSNRGGNVTEKDLARMKKALSKYSVKEVLIQLNGGSSNDQIVFSSDEWSKL